MRVFRPSNRAPLWGGAAAACFILPTFLTQGCEAGAQLETRTFDLQHMRPEEAVEMVRPYVYTEREGAPGVVSHFGSGITVRETPEALARIDAVLQTYDRAKPGVRLHFQVIQADGYEERDDRIEDVRAALEALFRFDGYRLGAETQMALMQGTSSNQRLSVDGRAFQLDASVEEIRGSGDRGSVAVSVYWQPLQGGPGPFIHTTLAVPVGETVVLGSSQPTENEPMTILTVRPEFVPLTGGS